MAAVEFIKATFKESLRKLQEEIDTAVSNDGLSEGVYLNLCELTKTLNADAKADMTTAKKQMFAEMVVNCPSNAREFSADFPPWDPELMSTVLEMAKKFGGCEESWDDLVDEYIQLIFHDMAEWRVDSSVRMQAMVRLVDNTNRNVHGLILKRLKGESQCFLAEFIDDDDVDELDLFDFAVEILASAPRLICDLKRCPRLESSNLRIVNWEQLKRIARACATDDDWQDAEFVGLVGPQDKKRKRSAAECK